MNDYNIRRQPDPQSMDDGGCMKKEKELNINVILNMGKGGHMGHGEDDRGPMKSILDMDKGEDGEEAHGGCEIDWNVVGPQLLQVISMMDSHTDAALDGKMPDGAAIQALDNETSRVLWGKQEEANPLSSYQNANYSDSVAAGLIMENPAVLDNKAAYGPMDPDVDSDVDFWNSDVMKTLFKDEGFSDKEIKQHPPQGKVDPDDDGNKDKPEEEKKEKDKDAKNRW